MLYFESNCATVRHNETMKTVETSWKNVFPSSEEYRHVLNKALEIVSKHKPKAWLSDMSNENVVRSEDNKWVQEFVIPTAYKNGVKKAAFVLSESVFTKMHADNLKKAAEKLGTIEIKYFKNKDEAYKWINV